MTQTPAPAAEPISTPPPVPPPHKHVSPLLWTAGIPILLAVSGFLLPTPDGIDPHGMAMLGIFVGTIAGLILQPLPTGSVALIGLAVAMITRTQVPADALAGFSNSTIWLIVAAFFIAEGFLVTGLGERIALHFVVRMGRSSLGLSYGMALTDLLLAPATPSNTARAGGVVYPIIASLSKLENSQPEPDESRKRLGAFLLLTSLQVNVVTSAMFVTAMAGNPLAVAAAAELGVDISWARWAIAASVPGIASIVAVPWVMSKIYPPTVKRTPEAPKHARERLAASGSTSRPEKIMAATFVGLLVLWCAGSQLGINATSAAFAGVAVLLVTKVLTWKNLVTDTGAWQTLVFFAVLVGMASQLQAYGVIGWVGDKVSGGVAGLPWLVAFAILTAVYFYAHYLFASNTAQIVAMYAVFLAAALAAGAPPLFAALVLGFIGNLFGGLAHYSSGPAGVIFGSGFVKTSEWFRIGFVMSVVLIAIWTVIGGAWMKLLGIW
ncbi:DASS family sodium-coupled anion symporter [Rhodococcus sp. IEGM 1381]|uniref:DASS family sodium-coupled anion symporter n=1 Tax=Rhodococcus sp. IEGM 1381 TaxID=3047085 RepID=UPI0024B6C634|nr:DASS family sodium-coupled anion symporter [Rhodococcus sp. IEGM 1381]MDI9893746.1 DASS family sodium-coupled anion symporter [Rhodococcus sp. IEGM 1381]